MASAILTVLWPDVFSVYDVRVCQQLEDFHALADATRFDEVWNGYQAYLAKVDFNVRGRMSLRDKDRVLWARSARQQLQRDIENGFPSKAPDAKAPAVEKAKNAGES